MHAWGGGTGDERHRVLAKALARYGLWDHLPAGARAAAEAEVADGGYPLRFDLLHGQVEFFADGEELAEGGVVRFLRSIAPALARYGLTLHAQAAPPADGDHPDDYVVAVNGVRCTVLRRADLEDGRDFWTPATVRPLAVVNRLLAGAAASPVRAHTLYAGGNDGLLLLLDPRAVAAMRASGLFPDHELPELATEQTQDAR
ncbi:hypothetical protein [Streptacidiphilus anmyonensis]|uniref:hypothetical protein n=1 Tax=Streptacidiphilus anmyonensis TaxID=405782 RepID=UPI0005AA633C|nr:hypothetical protein [Streptacidiphilus anmyonensis]